MVETSPPVLLAGCLAGLLYPVQYKEKNILSEV